jgi:hypothetical protein
MVEKGFVITPDFWFIPWVKRMEMIARITC